jgi:hypothetical protein
MVPDNVHCVLCLNTSGELVPATTALDGYQVCTIHAKTEAWVWKRDNTPDLLSTVANYRQARAAMEGLSPT